MRSGPRTYTPFRTKLRVKGEWFRYEEPLISHIAQLVNDTAA